MGNVRFALFLALSLGLGATPPGMDLSRPPDGAALEGRIAGLETAWAVARARVRQAEAASTEGDLCHEQLRLFARCRPPAPHRLRMRAVTRLCWERREKADGAAILAFQHAGALGAMADAKQCLAEALAAFAQTNHQADPGVLLAALEVLGRAFAALEEARATVGVGLDFLEAQETDFTWILATLLDEGEALARRECP